jgi:hypothetical protein
MCADTLTGTHLCLSRLGNVLVNKRCQDHEIKQFGNFTERNVALCLVFLGCGTVP